MNCKQGSGNYVKYRICDEHVNVKYNASGKNIEALEFMQTVTGITKYVKTPVIKHIYPTKRR